MKLVKHIANLGYGSRKDVQWMFREGRITDAAGEVLYADDRRDHDDIRIDGQALDPPTGLLLLLHKPVGYTCSSKDPGRVVFDLFPPRREDLARDCFPRSSRAFVHVDSEVGSSDRPVGAFAGTGRDELEGHGRALMMLARSSSVKSRLRPAILPKGRPLRKPCNQRRET